MDWKKYLQVLLGSWAVLLFLMVLTNAGEGMDPRAQIVCTGVLAGLITLLAWVAKRGERIKTALTLYAPDSAEVLWRLENVWLYRGWEETASLYLRKDGVYSFSEKKPLYLIKKDGLYRPGESRPFLRREGDKVLSCPDNTVLYEIK